MHSGVGQPFQNPVHPTRSRRALTGHAPRRPRAEAALLSRDAAEQGRATHASRAALGESLQCTGHLEEAIGAPMRAATVQPDYFPTDSTLSSVFELLGMHREAVECLRTALALFPKWAPRPRPASSATACTSATS
ncbi:MAG: tetratricopeptide repeat protein [Burkholderiales bacterium]|nr:MAG: tetratricopeptide repeat protein [Burkholderiales bacterium]